MMKKCLPAYNQQLWYKIGDIIELFSTNNTEQPFTFYNDFVLKIVN